MLEAVPIICPILPLHPLPRITADLPGFGGQLKVFTEDFVVEELPLYEPAGSGDHLYLWIEKVDVAAETLRRHVARMLEISGVDVGMAGLKDRRAITRQWISVPRSAESKLERLNTDRIKVLDSKLHRNKLRTAHLRGNRFEIRVRHVLPGAYALAQAKIERLLKSGVPNFTAASAWATAVRRSRRAGPCCAVKSVLRACKRLMTQCIPSICTIATCDGWRRLRCNPNCSIERWRCAWNASYLLRFWTAMPAKNR